MRLIVDDVAQARGSHLLFEGVSFSVVAGEMLVLKGPNGAGKTTLLRTIAGLSVPLSGSIRLEGGDDEARVGEQAHWVGHANAIKSALTVIENVRFWSSYLDGDASSTELALAALGLVDLADIPAGYLSAGQKRRLGLARLLVAKRPLWLLDEPTVSLDVNHRDRLAALMRAHLAGGGLIVAATHLDLGVASSRDLDISGFAPRGDASSASRSVRTG